MYITFTNQQYLWWLLSIPVLIITHFAFLRYTRRKAIKFANFQALKRVAEQKIVTRNYILLLIRILIIISLVLAISGSTFWYHGRTNNMDVVIAIDTSSSMTAQDIKPTRLEAAKDRAKAFVNDLSGDSQIGIVSFSGAAFVERLLTKDKALVKQSISDLDYMHTGGTDIPGAIVTSSNLLLNSKRGKTIVLMTDGSNTAGYFTRDPIGQAINYAKQNSVTIYTIGLGSNAAPIGYLPEYYNISSVYDEVSMKRIANETGGTYYFANDAGVLRDAYAQILEQTKESDIGVDLSVGLLIVCLSLLFLEWGLANTRFRSIP